MSSASRIHQKADTTNTTSNSNSNSNSISNSNSNSNSKSSNETNNNSSDYDVYVYVRAADGKKARRVKRSKKKQDEGPAVTVADVVQQAIQQEKEKLETATTTKTTTETTPLFQLPPQEASSSSEREDSDLRTSSQSSSHVISLHSLFQVTEQKRLEALEHEGVGRAAFLIRDAVLGLTENPADGAYDPYAHPEQMQLNTISVLCRRICSLRSYRRFVNIVVWILVLLTFVEPPNWCRYMLRKGEDIDADGFLRHSRCQEFMTSTGVPASNGGDEIDTEVQYYPNTSTMFVSVSESHIIECVCLICLWTYVWLRIGRDGLSLTRYFRAGVARAVRIVEFSAMACLTLGLVYDICTTMDKERYMAPYMRILIFIASSHACMREFRTLLCMMPEVLNVLVLLFLFIAFYAWIGVVAFYGSEEGKQYFPNFVDAVFTLWIATTTANYPDCMMPVYNTNRLSTLYFIMFMIVTFFFLMNVILASVVNAYDNELDRRRVERQDVADHKLFEAFTLMDPKDTGGIDRDTVMALFLILNQDFPEFRTIPLDEARLLFAILDKDGTDHISKNEFMDFGNVLLLEFERIRLEKLVVERCFPKVFVSNGYNVFAKFIESNTFEFTIDGILVLNAIVVFIQSYAMLKGDEVDMNSSISDGSVDTVWEFFETIFTCIYVVEISTKILVKGWHNFSQSSRNLFDMTITLLAVFATAYVYYPNEFSDSRLIRFIVMARVLRLTRLLVKLAPFQMIAKIAIDVFARAKVILLLLFCVCYMFAALGVQVFGGMITRDPEDPRSFLLLDSDFAANEYWANNFNDMFGAMNVLFNLLVVNNWTECQDGFEAVTQHRYNRLFFVCFHIVGVILVNNLVVAFVINAFIKQWDYRQEELKTHIVEGEAVIIGRRALFDAQQVTGTYTNLKGQYIAKIGRRTLFDEQHQQRILRSMFTTSQDEDTDKLSSGNQD